MLYYAYGSNLDVQQMAHRCPNAKPLGRFRLKGWRLVFRGVADCIEEPGAVCYGGIWRITPHCEYALDIYEGVSGGLYRKHYIPVKETDHGETEMLIYTMSSTGIMPPSQSYLGTIRRGYRDFAMPRAAYRILDEAVCTSWDDKAPTHAERRRRRRNGNQPLAPRPEAA